MCSISIGKALPIDKGWTDLHFQWCRDSIKQTKKKYNIANKTAILFFFCSKLLLLYLPLKIHFRSTSFEQTPLSLFLTPQSVLLWGLRKIYSSICFHWAASFAQLSLQSVELKLLALVCFLFYMKGEIETRRPTVHNAVGIGLEYTTSVGLSLFLKAIFQDWWFVIFWLKLDTNCYVVS